MSSDVTLVRDTPKRLGFLAAPQWIRATIPEKSIGVYMLLREGTPFYVGRSDHCVSTRLCNHEKLFRASHVVWEPCHSREHAYRLEAAWYHILANGGEIENEIHPSKPSGYEARCPFCDQRDIDALIHAIPHLKYLKNSASDMSPSVNPGIDRSDQ